MRVRLVLGVVLVANILVLVVCSAETTQATATSESSASTTSSYASSSSSSEAVATSTPVKCRRVMKCPKNEEFSSCAQTLQRPQYCTEKAEPFSTSVTTLNKSSCKKACVCKENYLRAANGTCIPAEQCPVTCGANELLDNCPADCDSDYCPTSEVSEDATCATPDVCPPPICKCTFNHRRASNGSCIPTKNCPPFACKTNEEFNACPPLCPTDDCSQASPSGQCPPQFGHIGIILPCNPKCRCIKDYWRLDGICVPYGQCPGVCPAHERYSECLQGECKALNCTQKDQSIPCARIDPKYCEKGCVCEEGYLRNADGVCVPEDKCEPLQPSCISANEEFVSCMQGVCRAKNCSQKGQDVSCPDVPTEECDSGCICKEQFLRAANGTCVPEDQCEHIACHINEELSNCTQAVCRAQDCYDKYFSIPCPSIAEGSCEKGCVCKSGYLRDLNNVCIPSDECQSNPCDHNKRPTNCTQAKCVQKCFDARKPQECPLVEEEYCKTGCVCQDGYLEAEDGYCVPEDQCESTRCPPFEQWSFCSNAVCRAQQCYQKGIPLPCPSVSQCNPGCVCQENYLRDEFGVCVPEEECESQLTCGENEVLDDCPPTCNTDYCPQSADDEEKWCVQADPCVPACKCRFNYKRATNETCIPTRDCPPFDCSAKPNEEYVSCPPYCPSDACGKPRLEGRCPFRIGVVLQCKPQCQCKDGYGRLNGTCVPFAECPNLCSANEMYSPCMQQTCRPQNCSNRDVAMGTCPTFDEASCQRGCVCQENFYRNDTGVCVPYTECGEPQLTCGENEVLDNCSSTCNTDDCPQSAEDEDVPCTQADPCVPACKCRFNYKRATNGTCIPTTDCPPFDCSAKPNEEYVSCPPICPSDACGKPRLEGICPFRIGIVLQCEPQCQCKDGYGRLNGTCVPFAECPNLCSANEMYSPCMQQTCRPQNCSNRDVAMGTCPTFDEASCQRGCVCQENFYRNDTGVCVSYKECGEPQLTCGENEVLDNCSSTCNTDDCPQSADDEDVPCTQADPCVPACKCRFNYKRATNGTCIPTTDCPPFDCSAKPNEEYVSCPPICPSDACGKPRLEGICPYRIGRIGIVPQCEPQCQCKDGYGRLNGTCVPFAECPNLCSANEMYSPCMQQTCRPQNCSNRDVAMGTCPTFDEASCQRGCVCQENFYRNDTGVCVPYTECEEPLLTCGENEVLDNCSSTCNTDDCPQSAEDEDVPCTQADPCVPACKCRFNYKRATNGTCIPTTDCPPFDCSAKPNEEYVSCPAICPSDACGKPRLEGICPYRIGIVLQCEPQCQCKDGYGRLNGTCVPFAECPNLCSANEMYSPCMQQTCRPQNCSNRDVAMGTCPTFDEASCQRGCVCQENFYRNDTGVCVPYTECGEPQLTCGENEVLDNCSSTCNTDDCPQSADDEDVPCTQADPCVPACKCRFNYKRATNGICIPTTDCPPFDCSAKPNEEYVSCPPYCPSDACGKPRLEGRCPFRIGVVLQCKPQCQCKDGYGRLNGTCVPFAECPDLCPANEMYSPCMQQTCRPQNCSNRDVAMGTCPTFDEASCQRGCVCQENFYRNDTGVCVPYTECGEPQLTCGENEVLDNCSSTCNIDDCPQSADDEDVPCTQADPCVPACKCRFNYKRATNGTCIPTTDCPPFDCSAKPNEEYVSCPPICPSDACGKPRLEGICPYRIGIVLQCEPQCQCKDGYGRLNGTCVPFAECPDLCPANEMYSPCMQQTCRPQNCSNRDVAMGTCPTFDEASCQRGCVCQENFFRNDTGVCVPYTECGAPNCSANEERSACAQATCRAQNCTEKGKPVLCPRIPEGSCEEACVCKENYLRNENGDCVPEDQCEPQLTCGENEVLDDCPSPCNTDDCPQSAEDQDLWCAQADPCVPACKCRFNYKRATNGTCIPTKKCPAFDCSAKPNEEYVSCPPFCPSDECGKPRLEGRCPFKIGVVLQCKPKCQCKDGYGRLNGTCVQFADCPDLCPANEMYSSCTQQTCRPQNCSNRDVAMETCPTIDEASCQRGCVCQENFYRNNGGVCVSYKECGGPMCPNAHEVYTPKFKKCPPNICNSLVAKYKCDGNQKEEPACACKPGYLRLNETSPCIPICECPEMKSSPDCK